MPNGKALTALGSTTTGLGLRATTSQTIDGRSISGRVEASGSGVVLTIRNSQIRYSSDDSSAVKATNGARIVLEDSEIDGMGQAGRYITGGRVDLLRVWVRNANEGPRLATGQRIINSRISDFFQGPNPDLPTTQKRNHVDGVQATGAKDVKVLGSYIDVNVTQGTYKGYRGNAAAQLGEEFGSTEVEIAHNYVAGGQVALAANGGGSTGTEVSVHHNTFKGDWRYGSRLKRDPAINRNWDVKTNVYAPGHAKAGQSVPAVD